LNFIEVCRKLISIDTSPGSSTLELAHYLATLSREMGLEAEVIEEMHNGVMQANIIVRDQPLGPGQAEFLLQTHLDTVDPDNFSLWKKNDFNPYEAAIEDGRIYGLGAADVKLDFLCKLQVLKNLKGRITGAMRPVLIGTFGEETGMHGTLKLIRKNRISAKYAVLGETTNLQIANASKGYAVVEIRLPFTDSEIKYKESRLESESVTTETKVFSGKSAHSSTPHLGDNAVQKLFDFLQKMPENMVLIDMDGGTRFNMVPNQAMIELELTSHVNDLIISKLNKIYRVLLDVENDMKLSRNSSFEPDHSTLSIGLVRCNDQMVRIGGSCRVLPNITQAQYEGWMTKIQKVCEEVGAQFQVLDYKKPFYTDEKSLLIKTAQSILERMGLDSKCRTLASTNEASLLSRLGVECICIGAGIREGNVHTPQEHVKIEDLEKVTAFYEQLVERFCL